MDDIEAVRAALGVDKLTLIGVSYGTFLAQAYAARYPTHVERVLLDSVLDVLGLGSVLPRHLRRRAARAAERSAAADLPGLHRTTRWPTSARLVTRLGRRPLHGQVTLPNGHRRAYGLTRQELFFTLVAGDLDELGAGLPGRGQVGPARRLRTRSCGSKRQAVPPEGAGSPREFSSGLYAATTCEEIPFPWPRFSTPPAASARSPRRSLRSPSRALYPFDPATDEGNDFIRMCRRWPEASPAPYAAPAAGSLPDVPVLMLSGDSGPAHPDRGRAPRRRALAPRAGARPCRTRATRC